MKEIQYMPIGNMKPSYKAKAEYWYKMSKLYVSLFKIAIPVTFVLGFVIGTIIF